MEERLRKYDNRNSKLYWIGSFFHIFLFFSIVTYNFVVRVFDYLFYTRGEFYQFFVTMEMVTITINRNDVRGVTISSKQFYLSFIAAIVLRLQFYDARLIRSSSTRI